MSIESSIYDPKTRDLKLYDYLIKILKEVQESIGGVNNFEIHVDPIDNVARIIDLNYVDTISKENAYDKAFQIEAQNLSGTVRSYNLQSKIFPEQGAMIAIGAQVKGGNTQGTSANTLLDFNNGLEDRIIPKKLEPFTSTSNNTDSKEEKLANDINRIKEFFLPPPIEVKSDGTPASTNQASNSEYKSSLRNLIVYFQEIGETKTNGRSIIPVQISLTMDGIGGLVIGHLFKIPPDLLPKGYGSDNIVGGKLIQTITSIGHKVENGDWTTTIDALNIVTRDSLNDRKKIKFNDLLKEGKDSFILKTKENPPPTPNADSLRSTLKTLGYNVKGDELSNGGDISKEIAIAGIAVAKKIKEKLPTVGITFTSGNDKFHQSLSYNSRHKAGNAIDLTVIPATSNNLSAVEKIIQGFAAGNTPNFRFINEYTNPTKESTGGHFHLSWGPGSEGAAYVSNAVALANKKLIEKYSV